jgi:hypothetical protein
MNDIDATLSGHGGLDYVGLAPFLRASIAGRDLRLLTEHMLQRLDEDAANPNLLMNLSIAAQCLNQMELGLEFQKEALALQRSYTVPATQQPARLRLLVLVTAGNIQSNTPLDCLLEASDIELIFHYVSAGADLLAPVPAHDLLFVGISDSDANRGLLQDLGRVLEGWRQPVLNAPRYLPFTGRDQASALLQDIPHLVVPVTQRVSQAQLQALADGRCSLSTLLQGCAFPVIVRPVGSQAGVDLQKIDDGADLQSYLAKVGTKAGVEDGAKDFFIAPFIDYGDASGHFRKIRIALIGGQAFVCHMAVSTHWMIHYVNAGMYAEEWKRRDEARFMQDFAQFASRHQAALAAISQRMQLEYLVMDCAQTRDGDLLLFEIDHGGVVHAMDVESLFPYKNAHILKAKQAFCALLHSRLPQTAGHDQALEHKAAA